VRPHEPEHAPIGPGRLSTLLASIGVPTTRCVDRQRCGSTVNDDGASVLFIADSTALTSPDHPVLVVDLLDDGRRPFRYIPPELWGVDNNLNIANMDWTDFADAVDEGGVFRGFPL
jgi:hypothetical protein